MSNLQRIKELLLFVVVVQGGTELFWNACRTYSTLIFYHSTNQILNLWRCFLITTGGIELEAHDAPLASSKIHAFCTNAAILDDTNVRPLRVTVPAILI